MLFKTGSQTAIGIDIGAFSIKLMQILKKSNQIRILSCGFKRIPKDSSQDEKLILLKGLCKESGIAASTPINTSVSGKNIVTRYDLLPVMTKVAFAHSLRFEHEKYIPFPLNECVVDIDILSKKPDGKMNVLIVSAKKNYIDKRANLIKNSGLALKTITVDSLALYKVFSQSPLLIKDKSFVILNIGHSVTNLLIIKNGEPVFSRDTNIGGENFTRSIADKKGVSFGQAEELKARLDEPALSEILSIDLNSLISEIELSIAYSRKNHGLKDIDCVYVSGGSAPLKGLQKAFGDALGTKVDFWNPFLTIKTSKKFTILENYYHDLILSLGIALS